jgi:hypothetical protein
MKMTQVSRNQRTGLIGGRLGSKVPFASACPNCAELRAQPGYDRNSLLRLLSNGYPVEAYCSACDEFWSISAKERAVLVAAAIASGGTFVC